MRSQILELEKLAYHIETICLRIESGQSFEQSLSDAPRIRCEKKWAQSWQLLRKNIYEGRCSALSSMSNFHESLKLEISNSRLLEKKSLLPKIQAWSVVAVSLLFLIVSQLFFSEFFRLSIKELTLILTFYSIGILWIRILLKKFLSQLWFLQWLQFLSSLQAQISWGQSFLQAFTSQKLQISQLPHKLRKFLEQSLKSATQYEPLNLTIDSNDPLEKLCLQRWQHWHRQFLKNEPLLKSMQNECRMGLERFRDLCERQSDKLSAKLMLPLFCCFLPAYLMILFTPLIRILFSSQSIF